MEATFFKLLKSNIENTPKVKSVQRLDMFIKSWFIAWLKICELVSLNSDSTMKKYLWNPECMKKSF